MAQFTDAAGLIGPPPIEKTELSSGDPFLELIDSKFNSYEEEDGLPAIGLTDNATPTFLSSGNPLLDFFFQIVPGTPPETLIVLLSEAWKRDSLTSLKLILQLRGVRGTGKSDREGFYTAALWLHHHHPKTLALNLPSISALGCFKDLPEILHRLISKLNKAEQMRAMSGRKRANLARRPGVQRRHRSMETKKRRLVSREERLSAEFARMKLESDSATVLRREKRGHAAARAVAKYSDDPRYRFLHDRVSEHFAAALSSDIACLEAGRLGQISLAAKWCPSLDSCFDRSTLLCEGVARRLFPRESDPELVVAEEAHYAYRVRDCLRRALVSLRRILDIPEVHLSTCHWESLPCSKAPSVGMKNYKEKFNEHDDSRFNEFFQKVKDGKAKVSVGALLPHEILASIADGQDDGVAERQWQRMVEDMAEKGFFKNCLAICDVSGSMSGALMEVCIALGLLVSELSEVPWKGRVITFSKAPNLHAIKGTTIKEKMNFVRTMEAGMDTNFQKVFESLLKVAVKARLKPEQMIKRLFVFSDMDFDAAGGKHWETDYQVICRKHKKAGYEDSVPEIVFWNLRNSRSAPVPSTNQGVALVSGFSNNLMKLFLEGDGVINPVDVMEQAISGEEYEKLQVFD